MAGAVVALMTFLFGLPAVVAGLGFKTAGILAGSIGAWMMRVWAVANGGGVAAGSLVAWLQSIGATGVIPGLGFV